MIRISETTKIYVHCPAGLVTGGAELLHQFVSILNDNNRNAYIVYFGGMQSNDYSVPSEYCMYNIKQARIIEDSEYNVEVIYEGVFNLARNNKKIQKLLWWLSVDNFYICSSSYLSILDLMRYDIKMAAYAFIKRTVKSAIHMQNLFKKSLSLRELKALNAVNGYQSEYAHLFLYENGFYEVVALKDFINSDYNNLCDFKSSDRKDIVLYNPKKGLSYTKKLMALANDINWVPLQNMTRSELVNVMRVAKVYVDFGYHPGKDRLPRECAANGCCVITGMRGSANYFEDVPIPSKYKFDEKHANKKDIIRQIRWVLNNYDEAIVDYKYYRHQISREKLDFENQILNIFS